jgi:hypothetical protein
MPPRSRRSRRSCVSASTQRTGGLVE